MEYSAPIDQVPSFVLDKIFENIDKSLLITNIQALAEILFVFPRPKISCSVIPIFHRVSLTFPQRYPEIPTALPNLFLRVTQRRMRWENSHMGIEVR